MSTHGGADASQPFFLLFVINGVAARPDRFQLRFQGPSCRDRIRGDRLQPPAAYDFIHFWLRKLRKHGFADRCPIRWFSAANFTPRPPPPLQLTLFPLQHLAPPLI